MILPGAFFISGFFSVALNDKAKCFYPHLYCGSCVFAHFLIKAKLFPFLIPEEIERIITPPAPAMPTTTVGAPDDAGEVLAPEMVEDPTMAEQALGAQAVAPNEEVI